MMESLYGQLPTGWVEVPLKEIVSHTGIFSDGDWVESKDQDPKGDVRLVQLADIGEMTFLNKSRRYMNGKTADAMNCTFLQSGDLLISRLGDPLGKTCVYPGLDARAVTAVDVCVLRPDAQGIEPKLFGYFLNSGILRREIDAQSSGTTRKRITGNKLKALSIRVPPSNEQSRIVDKIETLFTQLDQGEASLRSVQTLLTRYRQSVLKAAVTGQLTADWRAENAQRLEHGRDLLQRILQTRRDNWQGRGKYKEPTAPDTSDLPDLPEGWVWGTVEQLGFIVSGQTPAGIEIHLDESGTIPWFKISSMNEPGNERTLRVSKWMLTEEGITASKLNTLPEGAIVFPKRGGAILTNKKRRLGCRAGIDLNTMGFVPALLSNYAWTYFQGLDLRSIYDGSNVPQINYHDIADLRIAIPSCEDEAEQIADIVDAQIDQISTLETWCIAELTRSTALRQSILKDAFAGRLVPQDPNDEPASALLARIRAEREAANKPAARGRGKAGSATTVSQHAKGAR